MKLEACKTRVPFNLNLLCRRACVWCLISWRFFLIRLYFHLCNLHICGFLALTSFIYIFLVTLRQLINSSYRMSASNNWQVTSSFYFLFWTSQRMTSSMWMCVCVWFKNRYSFRQQVRLFIFLYNRIDIDRCVKFLNLFCWLFFSRAHHQPKFHSLALLTSHD